MALLLGSRVRVTTTAGVPVNGGWVRIRNTGTSTLSTLYTDASLTTPSSNPLQAASDGWTPQFYAAEGLVVDVAFFENDAGSLGSEITGNAMTGATFAGQSSSTFSRDFTTSRIKISGSGGVTQIETGDASGDDTGGSARMGGWAGTQGTDLELDYASVNVTTAGTLTEANKALTGVVYTPVTSFSAASEVDVDLPNSPAGVIGWDVIFWDLANTNDCQLRGRFSYDNDATYKSGASDYASAVHAAYNNTTGSFNDSAEAYMHLSGVVSVKVSTGGFLTLRIISVTSGTGSTCVDSKLSAADATASLLAVWNGAHLGLGSYGKATNFRLYPSAGTITGKYRVVPLRGFA